MKVRVRLCRPTGSSKKNYSRRSTILNRSETIDAESRNLNNFEHIMFIKNFDSKFDEMKRKTLELRIKIKNPRIYFFFICTQREGGRNKNIQN